MERELLLEVDRQAFLLRPDKPAEGEPRKMFDGETETELSPAAQERAKDAGVIMHRPYWSPNTMLVHEATQYAKEKSHDNAFHHAAAKAYWENGADLADMSVIKGFAQECGLNWDEMSSRLESGYYRKQVLEQYEKAKELGVGGTPAYEIGGTMLPGDISYEALKEAIEKALST